MGDEWMIKERIIKKTLVIPGKTVSLKDFGTGWAHYTELKDITKEDLKKAAEELLEENRQALASAQELLWASNIYSVLIVLQGMDTAGKDGTIRHVMSGVNPQGVDVSSFKVPTPEEVDHDFLWRYSIKLPSRGSIGIFNRSYYEDVLVVRVHPEILDRMRLPPGKKNGKFWEERFEDINAFERHLAHNGTLILKFFLHISKEEQKKRLLKRLENVEKHWKFSQSDLAERQYWDSYQDIYEKMLENTSTEYAPWYVIPADFKWVARTLIADIISTKIQALDLHYPEVSDEAMANINRAKTELNGEKK
ncbi:polyphosphate kinase 2 family protein [Methanoplanus endosymbiosus]|uniref:Polyphosphate kinase 2 family protein n=1 Tax=Methanoplanus endosymbiosus TaxID=33865 RepID=A0A9E7TKF8_9EURY|nr:polyphosphate kinase 2 family protein [Methanoplanus endosymbiosus]UUX91171.1 polyphosphate kinase 2 family protein [Methanoplanus endosymbiosus]